MAEDDDAVRVVVQSLLWVDGLIGGPDGRSMGHLARAFIRDLGHQGYTIVRSEPVQPLAAPADSIDCGGICPQGECDDDLSDVCSIGSSGGDYVRSNLHPLCGGCSCDCHDQPRRASSLSRPDFYRCGACLEQRHADCSDWCFCSDSLHGQRSVVSRLEGSHFADADNEPRGSAEVPPSAASDPEKGVGE